MFRAVAIAAVATAAAFPQVIQLPRGFQPEGIEIGRGNTFYVGSVANGAVLRGDLRTGRTTPLVDGQSGKAATGIELDRFNRLFVAGAGTGDAYVYNARTGAPVRTYDFASGDTFINDLVVTPSAAYFTDSRKGVLYVVPIARSGALGAARKLPLRNFAVGAGFNL